MPEVNLTPAEVLAIPAEAWPERLADVRVDCEERVAREADGLSPADAKFVQEVVAEARKEGILGGRRMRLTYCGVCKRKGERFQKRRGSSKWHTRGFDGVDLVSRFVQMQGYPSLGCCTDCLERLTPALRKALRGIPCQMRWSAKDLATEGWEKVAIRECTQCGWTGLETEMGRRPTLFGDGRYFAVCPTPDCGAENALFSTPVKATGRHKLVRLEER